MKMFSWFGKDKSTTPSADAIKFTCNICGTACTSSLAMLGREIASCHKCSSTVRMRSIIHILSMELFGKSIALPDFPLRQDIKGIGMSDWDGYAIPMASKLEYENTFYHKEPKLDITKIDMSREGTLDFIISTDVFEHVESPVSIAFQNARKLLKPNGVFIFSVPYTLNSDFTKEHFTDLHDYKMIEVEGSYELHNITQGGETQIFKDLVLHGGEGDTLEMRLFSLNSLQQEFDHAGFNKINIYSESYPEFGIYWNNVNWSLPISARA